MINQNVSPFFDPLLINNNHVTIGAPAFYKTKQKVWELSHLSFHWLKGMPQNCLFFSKDWKQIGPQLVLPPFYHKPNIIFVGDHLGPWAWYLLRQTSSGSRHCESYSPSVGQQPSASQKCSMMVCLYGIPCLLLISMFWKVWIVFDCNSWYRCCMMLLYSQANIKKYVANLSS